MTRGVDLLVAARRFVAGSVAVAVSGAVWCVVHLGAGAGLEAVAYLFVPVGGLVAALSVRHLAGGGEPFWKAVLVAVAVITAGYTWLAVDMLAHAGQARTRSMPAGAAACVAAGFLIAIGALARVPVVAAGGTERWRIVLDRSIAFLGCSAVLWYVGLAPMLSAREPWSLQATLLVGLGLLVAVGAATKVSYIAGGPVDRVAMRFIAAAGGVPAALTSVLAVQFGYIASVPAQAVVMPLAPVLITLGVAAQSRADRGLRRAPSRGGVLLPYVAMIVIDVPLIAVAFGATLQWPVRIVLVAAVVVTALVMLRQYLAYRENDRLLERLQHEAGHDALTGLANRAQFREKLAADLIETGRTAVLLIDLDDFRTVNDLLGQGVGDRLLIAVAGLLREQIKDEGLPVRVGGDEFAVLLSGSGSGPEALA
ncbi:MAG TPA: GGDEF domain-containing protein, partial [Actinoplanes sp.]|nr:GGDEF domain-containing protein [Actinoplanes sp.]